MNSSAGSKITAIAFKKGSVRYYAQGGSDQVIRIDYHGSKEVPTGTCRQILKEAGIPRNWETSGA